MIYTQGITVFSSQIGEDEQAYRHAISHKESIEENRQMIQKESEQIDQKFNQLKKQYERQKLELVKEREKRMEAEERAALANRDAAKLIIRYGKVVARNLLKQRMDSLSIKNITGISDKELAALQEELDEE
ncbi:hypothetical protein [Oceanobacillus locisalsi]|uniref:Uncharacterized protein n=1 Tax=Oceanobacillus locisalsi TaxID=546107 RepID=A0ABW3NH92_9BACI